MKKILLSIIVILSLPVISAAQGDLGSTFVGARPMGMGGAFVGLSDDTSSVFVNPAGLAQIDKLSITSMSGSFLEMVDYKMFSGAIPVGGAILGAGVITSKSQAGYRTEFSGSDVIVGDAISYYENIYVISLGIPMDKRFSVGVSGKLHDKGFTGEDGERASSFAVDAGLLIKLSDTYSLGLAFGNIAQSKFQWESGYEENSEAQVKIGLATDIFNNKRFVLCIDSENTPGSQKPSLTKVGAEYRPFDIIALRAGIEQDSIADEENGSKVASNLTGGVGLYWEGFGFDYAYRSNSDQPEASTQFFSISYRFR